MSEELAGFARAIADRYRVDREIGAGGMATVYLALDLKHDRPVALKVLRPELQAALGADRFEREIRLAARLQHPHILSVHDSGSAGGRLWFTMPFVEGESLRGRLQRERQLSVKDAVRIAHEAGQALQYAHEHGVVHRDIKPDNILLAKDGSTLVADFGIARALDPATGPVLTATGMSLGTPAYMSPEQASGDRGIDARTDVYALGAVLYEMLAGEAPFTGPTLQAIIARRFSQAPPSVRAARPNVPEAIDQAIQRALALVPGDRFQTAAALVDALDAAPGDPSATVHTPVGASRRYLVTLALLTGLVIGTGVLFAWRRGSNPAPSADAAASVARLAVLPFENLGDSADEYFADGVTDAVRGKLTSLPALQVIARGSSVQYRPSTRPPGEIATELGVRYLLTGTVRWARAADGTSRVQVSPELVEIGADGTASSKWQQPFDAPLTDVFKVQADIATQVSQALRVALPGSAAQEPAKAPTASPEAYDAFLRGQAAWSYGANTSPSALKRAASWFERAVALDSDYAAAWAELSSVNSFLFTNSSPLPAYAERSRKALEHAGALDPGSMETHYARNRYLVLVERDPERALAEIRAVVAQRPPDARSLAVLGAAERSVGQWDSALTHFRAAFALDPRNAARASDIVTVFLWNRHPDSARAPAQLAHALAPTSPISVQRLVLLELQRGDVAAARRVLADQTGVAAQDMFVYLAEVWDTGWALDDSAQRVVLAADSTTFLDTATMHLVHAQLLAWRGDTARARVAAGVAAHSLEAHIKMASDDPQVWLLRGLALAHADRAVDARADMDRGLALTRSRPNAYLTPYYEYVAARTLLRLGDRDRALGLVESVMQQPYFITPAWLRIDPEFRPLDGHPRFERLAAARPT